MLSRTRIYAALPAADLRRARIFYEEKLGLSPAQDNSWALVYELEGGTRFSLFATANPVRGGHTQMGFEVTDLRAKVADLKKRRVAFEEYDMPSLKTIDGVADFPDRSAAWFVDTEGNVIEFLEFAQR
jgi:catechol 2,3-dioxygenase-like lactoylglutathione lyase family enzyme